MFSLVESKEHLFCFVFTILLSLCFSALHLCKNHFFKEISCCNQNCEIKMCIEFLICFSVLWRNDPRLERPLCCSTSNPEESYHRIRNSGRERIFERLGKQYNTAPLRTMSLHMYYDSQLWLKYSGDLKSGHVRISNG